MTYRPLHECPGGCGREDVPGHLFACPSCLERLPLHLRTALSVKMHRDYPAFVARAKLYWENARSGD